MNVSVSQIYVEVGASFPFSYRMQVLVSEKLSDGLSPSQKFTKKFGPDFEIIFRMSAKREISATEIRGPSVFRKAKDVEYSIFLPYDVLAKEKRRPVMYANALTMLLQSIVDVLKIWEIDTSQIEQKISPIVEEICSNSVMFKEED